MNFFIAPAYANEAAAPDTGFINIIFLLVFVAVFYFMLWRPQSKRAKEHKALVTSLAKGDEVVTNGGIIGKVIKADENYVVLEVGDNQTLKFQKNFISAALPKGTIKSI